VSRDAGPDGGRLVTPPVLLAGSKLTVNAHVRGELRAGLLDAEGQPIRGFSPDDCRPIQGDNLAHAVAWKGTTADLGNQPLQIEFHLREGELYGFDVAEE
jgi:hypothetical protein